MSASGMGISSRDRAPGGDLRLNWFLIELYELLCHADTGLGDNGTGFLSAAWKTGTAPKL